MSYGEVASTPWGTGARVSTFIEGWAPGAPWVETAKRKLTKLYWPSKKRLIVLVEPKKWRGTTTTKKPALHVQIRPGTTALEHLDYNALSCVE